MNIISGKHRSMKTVVTIHKIRFVGISYRIIKSSFFLKSENHVNFLDTGVLKQ